ncbi:MAG: initiation factor 2B [Desulfurococcaceae archaeon]
MSQELIKHGFAKRLSASELVLNIMDKIVNTSISDSIVLSKTIIEIYEELMRERPFSAAALNLLKIVVSHVLEKGFDEVKSLVLNLREEYLGALTKSIETASKRFENGDTLMVNTNCMSIRRLLGLLKSRGLKIDVYVAESRPGLEGLSLAEYVESLGLKVFLIVDSAMRFFMKNVDKVVIGAEAVLPDGSIVGKVGTSVLAFIAKEFNKEVISITPTHKFYYELMERERPKIPEKGWEVLMTSDIRSTLPPSYSALVPVYDITPPHYIDYLATEHGLISPYMVQIYMKDQYVRFAKTPLLRDLVTEVKKRYST